MAVINKQKIKDHFATAQISYPQNALAQQQINQQLINLLAKTHYQHFDQVLEIGCGTGDFTRRLLDYAEIEHFCLNDLYQSDAITELLHQQHQLEFIGGDSESFCLTDKFDLIVSASTVQWLTDKQGFIAHCAAELKPEGILLFNSFAPNNLQEIRALTGVGLDYPDIDEWRYWLNQYFHIQHISVETIQLTFNSPYEVLQHLRNTGVTATQKQIWTKKKLQQFITDYTQLFSTPTQQVSLTYSPMYIVAERRKEWKG